MGEKVKKAARSQYYAFIMYQESAPENWKQILEAFHVAMLVSPLHRPGKSEPTEGEPEGVERKPHWHVMILYGSLKSEDQAQDISKAVNGTVAFRVASKEGYARYLCHLDNPEKEQFSLEDVTELSGVVYKDNIGCPYNRDTVIREMTDYIRDNGIFGFAAFSEYCKGHNDTWYRALTRDCTFFIKEYMQSAYWEMKNRIELQQMEQQARENGNPFDQN